MLELLNSFDTHLFLSINGFYNSFFDSLMIFASGKLSWFPLYILLLYLIIRQYKWRSLLVLGFISLLILASDQLSVHAFKNIFQRLRPCHNEELQHLARTISGCGGQYGFVSSHATNSFALLVFISLLLGRVHRWLFPVLLVWGLLVAYSRVYLGVHYPGDVFFGAIVGTIIGTIIFLLFRFVGRQIYR